MLYSVENISFPFSTYHLFIFNESMRNIQSKFYNHEYSSVRICFLFVKILIMLTSYLISYIFIFVLQNFLSSMIKFIILIESFNFSLIKLIKSSFKINLNKFIYVFIDILLSFFLLSMVLKSHNFDLLFKKIL